MQALRLMVVSGSSRPGSFNGQLAQLAGEVARQAGAEVTWFDLRALALPLYDAQIEAAAMPAGAPVFRDAVVRHDALLVCSPEYNGFPTPLLINSFDWLSRVSAGGDLPSGLAALAGKTAGVMSASPGPLGGMRSLSFTRQFLHNVFGMLVVPEQFALGQAAQAFGDGGQLRDDRQLKSVQRVVHAVLRVAGALRVPSA
jgi:chromate reductase, NAD(P)H dehydrogenase (quinone)